MSLTDWAISGPMPSPSISVTVYLPCSHCQLPRVLRIAESSVGVAAYIVALLALEGGDLLLLCDGIRSRLLFDPMLALFFLCCVKGPGRREGPRYPDGRQPTCASAGAHDEGALARRRHCRAGAAKRAASILI